VIVGVGGPGAHPRLVRTALELARARGAVLYAVDVREENKPAAATRDGPPWMQEAYLAFARAGGQPDDVDVRIVITDGEPSETLVRLADRADDLLVVGCSHLHRGAPPSTGRVALGCAATARCAVIIVPPDPEHAQRGDEHGVDPRHARCREPSQLLSAGEA
jgi:nucleotide-binding universal stress UspA family protein